MVLDSVVDPTRNIDDVEATFGGSEDVLHQIVSECSQHADCPLAEGRKSLDALLAQLKSASLPTTSGRRLTGSLARFALLAAAYGPGWLPSLRAGLGEAIHYGRGDGLLAMADAYNDRSENGRHGGLWAGLFAVNCLVGDPDGRPSTSEELTKHAEKTAAEVDARAPYFGRWGAYRVQVCSVWPTAPTMKPQAITARAASPILLVNTTRDNATPLKGAQKVAQSLQGATLVVIDADGHIASGKGSCIDSTIHNFLFTGQLPDKREAWPAKAASCTAGD